MTVQSEDEIWGVEPSALVTTLKKRMAEAVRLLEDMIDGGEECRGRDSELSEVIRKLEGR